MLRIARWRRLRLSVVLALVGLAAGVAGIGVTLLLHAVQHLAWAYSRAGSDFLEAVAATAPARRFLVVAGAGVVAGCGWWALDRVGRPRVTIARAVAGAATMPPVTTIVHATLQIVTVALGSPLGREVAPREVAAACAQWIGRRGGLAGDDLRLVVACAAGAGLAAVYNVPLAGILFTLEVLLRSRSLRSIVAAVATSVVAVALVRATLGDVTQYRVPVLAIGASLHVWAALAGPLFGVAGFGFARLGRAARPPFERHGWKTVVASVLGFALLGLLAGPYPEVLGNGKGPAQVAFDGGFGASPAALVLGLKLAAVVIIVRVGAYGGLLTPAIACGALLAIVLGDGWSLWWPGPAAGAYALVGATAFLAASMAMPLTAIALLFEMTAMVPQFLAPIALAVAGATVAKSWCARCFPSRTE